MGLLDPTLLRNLKGLTGLLAETPIGKYVRGKDQGVSVEGLKRGLLSIPVFENTPEANQTAYEAAMNIGPMALGKIVYHGSPHKFDKFDASKIGTGEGAQAYGHGVYLADAEGVAKGYAENLKKYPVPEKLAELIPERKYFDPAEIGEFYSAARDSNISGKTLWNRNRTLRDIPPEKIQSAIDEIRKAGEGALYKADLPDEWIPKMLDWDKPLSEQSKEVQEAFNSWVKPRMSTREIGPELVDVNIEGGAIGAFTRDAVPDVLANPSKYVPTKGKDLWQSFGGDTFGRGVPDNAQRAKMLQQMGIPGIRYLDGGSRGKGQGSYNYVVFPGLEDQVKILERNGVPLGLLGGK